MRRLLPLVILLLAAPAMAEEPEEAADLWMEQYGTDAVVSVQYDPAVIHEGVLPRITIQFNEGHNITEVSGQYCRISGPEGGATCFRAGLESTASEDGNAWTIDLDAQSDEPFPIPKPVATERLGVQFFLTTTNGSQLNFPNGLPLDHPWFYGTEEEFLMWDETQYFAFDTAANESEPISLAWLPWALGSVAAAIGAALLFRKHRQFAVVLIVVSIALPVAFVVTQSTTGAQAPDFTLTDTGYEDGEFRGRETFSLSDYRGQTVVIDFMAYNCAACRHVTPNIMEPLWEEYGARGDFEILTIDVGKFSNFPGSSEENLVRWQTVEFDGPWRHALDDSGVFLDYVDLGALGLPSVFIIDAEGFVVYVNTGNPSYDEMAQIIEASFEGEAMQADVLTIGILGLAAIAGISSFFAPCSIGLIPAYMGFLLKRQNEDGKHHSTIPAGLATAGGIVSIYGVIALLLWVFQDSLSRVNIALLGPIMGGILIILGLLMLIGFDWERLATKFGLGKIDGRRGFFAFGVGYGLAAFGCTGPIFLPVLIAGFAQGVVTGFMAFLLYAVAVSSLVIFAAYLVGAGKQTRLNSILSHTKLVTRVSAAFLILGGAYLVFFDVSALV